MNKYLKKIIAGIPKLVPRLFSSVVMEATRVPTQTAKFIKEHEQANAPKQENHHADR